MRQLYDVADKLLTWGELKSLGIRDIMVDAATQTVALVGDPLKIELNMIIPGFVRNPGQRLNTSFGSHFGIPVEVEYWPRTYSVKNMRPWWFHGDDESGDALEDFLTNMGYAIRDVLLHRGEEVGEEDVRVTLLAAPGYPYTDGVTKNVYSAKLKKEFHAALPAYAIEVENSSHEEVLGVDFCKFLPVVCAEGKDAIVGRFSDGMDFLVTHSSGMAGEKIKATDRVSEVLKGCPGMLFPSLATGLVPATNFGETVLVVRPDVILPGMKPYKARGAFSVVTYNTDVWTETTPSFVGDIAAKAWQQLHGDCNWYYTRHLYTLGPDIKEEGFGGEEARMIKSTSSLASTMRKKFKKWRRDLNESQVTALGEQMSGERYGYLESKLNIILGWDCIPIAVCPQQWSERISSNLKSYGFKGKILAVPLEADMLDAIGDEKYGAKTDWMKYRYSWIVRDVVVKYAEENGLVFPVSE